MVASDGELRLHCSYNPQIQPQELVVALYRGMHGNQRVCIIGLNLTHSKPGFQTEGPIRCKAEHSLAGVDLVVSGLRGLDTDLYRCTLEVLYPPPYRIGTGNGTLFHIPVIISSVVFVIIIIILTIKALLKQKRRGYPGIAAVTARRVDCRFGYENFL
ncbi:hypothetical protein Z043_110183 [Scleropages formosus]|uniref:Uncharacterized protein n=1 Tax=Scleropages formosus TaxID=113540 RepID=A0A0P7X2Z0_SCLFO|nr:hypothetical protein Z043_110183 [Scleropages formosus]